MYSQKLANSNIRKNLGYLYLQALTRKMSLIQRKTRKFMLSGLILASWQSLHKGLFNFDQES